MSSRLLGLRYILAEVEHVGELGFQDVHFRDRNLKWTSLIWTKSGTSTTIAQSVARLLLLFSADDQAFSSLFLAKMAVTGRFNIDKKNDTGKSYNDNEYRPTTCLIPCDQKTNTLYTRPTRLCRSVK